MVTICILIAIAAIVYYYLHKNKDGEQKPHEGKNGCPPPPPEPKPKYGCPMPPVEPEEPAEPEERIVWQDDERKLYMRGEDAFLDYKGDTYSFGCQPYEPMALIYKNGKVVASIHNSFRVEEECEVLLRGQLVHTITRKYHNAERFALLLTTAIDSGCDSIEDVEARVMQAWHEAHPADEQELRNEFKSKIPNNE